MDTCAPARCSDELAKIPSEVVDDVSLMRPRDATCPECSNKGAVVIQAKPLPTDERIKLIFVCTNRACTHKWQQ